MDPSGDKTWYFLVQWGVIAIDAVQNLQLNYSKTHSFQSAITFDTSIGIGQSKKHCIKN
jgi:hypothetical protein